MSVDHDHGRHPRSQHANGPGDTAGASVGVAAGDATTVLAPHQRDAYESLYRAFRSGARRAQLVLPCGTGKTRVGAALAASLAATGQRRIAVFVPSLALVEQTLREWDAVPGLDIDPVVVCSDPTTAAGAAERGNDLAYAPGLAWHQKAVPVTTDPDRLARLLSRGPRKGQQVVFSTYHSAPAVATAVKYAAVAVTFDLLVADEAHRLAGEPSDAFQLVLDDNAVPATRRVFMTATPVTTAQDAGPRRSVRVSMDDPELFGRVEHKMTFAEAIAAGLLCDYRVVVVAERPATATPVDTAGKVDGRSAPGDLDDDLLGLASVRALRSTAVEHDLNRVLTFHGRVRAAERFVGFLNQAGSLPGGRGVWTRVVTADTPVRDRKVTLAELQDDSGDLRVVASARCLSEGVDLPAVDGVVFCSPKHSLVDIIQSVGRVLRRAPGKTCGTVVLPVALPEDYTPGGDDDSALLASEFSHVWSVLRALRSHDERLGDQLDSLTHQLSRRGTECGVRDVDRVTWMLPPGLDQMAATRLVREVGSAWESMLGHLAAFIDEHGHSRVPSRYIGPAGAPVGAWVHSQRKARRRGVLPADRARRLEGLPGWVWTTEQARWEENYQALAAHAGDVGVDLEALSTVKAAGHAHRTLGEFAAAQRIAHRAGMLEPDRQQRLERVRGWQWQAVDTDDARMVDVLADYVAWEGDPNVDQDYTDGPVRLGAWVWQLRRRRLAGTAPAALLDEVAAVTPGRYTPYAFRWEHNETQWLLGLDAARGYARREGNLQVPEGHRERIDGVAVDLHRWMVARRFEHRHGKLEQHRALALESIPSWRWEMEPPARTRIDLGSAAHGTRTGYVRGCRCAECAEANRLYNRTHAALARAGKPTSNLVDAAPTIEKLRSLLEQGAAARAIARESRISRSTVRKLLAGEVGEVTAATAARVAALTLEQVLRNVAGGTLVDAAETWRHLDAILERGWPKSWVARELGAQGKSAALQLKRTVVTAENAERVATLAERLGTRRPPSRARGGRLPTLEELLAADPDDVAGAA